MKYLKLLTLTAASLALTGCATYSSIKGMATGHAFEQANVEPTTWTQP